MIIFVLLMAEGFMGYLLPWGNMSYWGAQVIINLFSAIPVVGEDLAVWIRGDFIISGATLNRFFALHVVALPMAILLMVFLHIVALHKVGSNNPDGIDIKKHKDENGIPLDGIPFHPYYTVKDIVGVGVFLLIFCWIIFFNPEMGGYFFEAPNFTPADALKTPEHIAPVWYFTPYYSILKAVPNQGLGVIAMAASLVILFFLPWLDRSPVLSIRYKSPIFKVALMLFVVAFFILGYLGMKAPNEMRTLVARVCTVYYFAFFIFMPWWSQMGTTKPVPERVTH
jgi:ubiquinol-cytochrome c reductase cytochrome b subunit